MTHKFIHPFMVCFFLDVIIIRRRILDVDVLFLSRNIMAKRTRKVYRAGRVNRTDVHGIHRWNNQTKPIHVWNHQFVSQAMSESSRQRHTSSLLAAATYSCKARPAIYSPRLGIGMARGSQTKLAGIYTRSRTYYQPAGTAARGTSPSTSPTYSHHQPDHPVVRVWKKPR